MRWHTNFFACIRFSRRCAVARRFAAAMGPQTIFLLAFLASMALLAAADDTVETTADAGAAGEPTERVPGFTKAFGESFMVILATEIGDRTFFIAAIMAMRHSRFIIWSGAVGALVVMTVLSTLRGARGAAAHPALVHAISGGGPLRLLRRAHAQGSGWPPRTAPPRSSRRSSRS